MDKTLKHDAGGASTTFEQRIAVTPTATLITWLDGQLLDGKPRLLKLPIVLTGDFDISKARIGGAADALTVYANDSALGNGLADRCKGPTSCGFWVEGYWRGKQELGYQVDVMKVQGPIADLAQADHVQVEGETGN
ncbi:MAG: hypothetical protein ABI867_13470 [Kofleriaceae bacterium]